MPKHAYLSASASHRWLACPPSAKLCANITDQTSEYAQQGTDCHELCAYLVEKALGRAVTDPTENLTFYDAEMQNCAEEYRNYVLEQIEAAKEFCKDPQVMIEQRLDFSRWVENGFGTGDCVIVADEVLQIIDYKHGLGVLVSAGDDEHGGNSQMMCYALGALEAFGDIYDINQIKMTIFQPRRDNISTYTISREDLLKWADEVLAPTALLAYVGEEYALQQAQSGVHFEGWKIVAGRSNRKFTDEAAVASKVKDAGYDPYEKKLLGITAISTMLGKKKFEELLGELVYKPPGKPTLVPESDKRRRHDLHAMFVPQDLSGYGGQTYRAL